MKHAGYTVRGDRGARIETSSISNPNGFGGQIVFFGRYRAT